MATSPWHAADPSWTLPVQPTPQPSGSLFLDFMVERCFSTEREEDRQHTVSPVDLLKPSVTSYAESWRHSMTEELTDIVCSVMNKVLRTSTSANQLGMRANVVLALSTDVLPNKWMTLEKLSHQLHHEISTVRRQPARGPVSPSSASTLSRSETSDRDIKPDTPEFRQRSTRRASDVENSRTAQTSSPDRLSPYESTPQENLPLKKRKNCDSPLDLRSKSQRLATSKAHENGIDTLPNNTSTSPSDNKRQVKSSYVSNCPAIHPYVPPKSTVPFPPPVVSSFNPYVLESFAHFIKGFCKSEDVSSTSTQARSCSTGSSVKKTPPFSTVSSFAHTRELLGASSTDI